MNRVAPRHLSRTERLSLGLPLAIALVLAAGPPAEAATLKTISVRSGVASSLGAWSIATTSTSAMARDQLGVEDGQTLRPETNSCVRQWSFRGMRMEFRESRPGYRACVNGAGFAVSFTVFGQGGRANWRTGMRLQVGDNLKRLRDLYPAATFESGRWVLARFPSRSPWPAPAPARSLRSGASVVARVQGGHVTTLAYSVVPADALIVASAAIPWLAR